jgi:hypothetical protein
MAVGSLPLFLVGGGELGEVAVELKESTVLINETAEVSSAFVDDAVELTTSSKSLKPSRNYTIYDSEGNLHKFGVTNSNLVRYNESLLDAGPGSYGKYSDIIPKYQAHINEKYLRSLHYSSTGVYRIPGMKIPYPVNLRTGIRIKPIK